ncbi:MAG: RNA polymerase-associated protein RapA [Chloroflexi bacterium]|nr:RNA polymerase-associated protein RapA [Chloroflexota bacterium]
MTSLPHLLTPKNLKKHAGSQSYQRGVNYLRQGRVRLETVELSRVRARVLGTKLYWVNLWENEGDMEAMCTCPYAERGHFCKHMVATGLAAAESLPAPAVEHKNWLSRIQGFLDGFLPSPTLPTGHYVVAFCLGEEHDWSGSTWKLHAYRVTKLGTLTTANEIYAALKENGRGLGDVPHGLEKVNQHLNVEDCLNGPQVGTLAQSIALSSPTNNANNVSRWLTTFSTLEQRVPLFLEVDRKFLGARLHFHPHPLEFQLELTNPDFNTALRAQLRGEEETLTWEKGEMKAIAWGGGGLWALRGEKLLRVAGGVPGDSFRDWIETPHMQIPPGRLREFLIDYYPQMRERVRIVGDLPALHDIDTQPAKCLYLTDTGGELTAYLRFEYGGFLFDYAPWHPEWVEDISLEDWAVYRVHLHRKHEKEVYRSVSSIEHGLKYGQLAGENAFVLRANVTPIEFLMEHVPILAEKGFEIYGEEDLRHTKVNRTRPTLSLHVSSNIDWFDVQAVVEFGEITVDLADIRRALREKKTYVKLADGSVGEIPEEWMTRYRHLFGMGEQTGSGARFSPHHLTLIDQLLEKADQAQVDAEFAHRRQKLLDFSGIEQTPLPEGFQGELRSYQQAGYNWLHFLHEYRFGGILADDMGLGKTIETLALLQSLRENGHTTHADLLVLPRSLLVNWQREAEAFTPDLKVHFHYGPQREVDAELFDQHDLVLTTYGTMRNDAPQLREYAFHYVILDESQAIKNPQTKTSKAVRVLRSDHRLALTGTPVENTTLELWSQFAFLNPGLLGNLTYFKREFARPIENEGEEETARLLRKMVFPFILRRTKKQVAPELPPRTERVLYTDMEASQRKFYEDTRDYYRAKLLGLIDDEGFDRARMNVLEGLLRLRQISNHPKLVNEDFQGRSAKLKLLVERIESLRSEGHKALIFSQFVQMLKLIQAELEARKIPYLYLDGSTRKRQERIDEFQNNAEIPLFLISLRAGGVGLNLTAADYVIHVDPWWNPAVEQQATDRTHRIGQENPVFVYKLIARDSVEEKILELQERKKALVEQVISTESSFFKSLSVEDVKVLFS